jgi:hypothetical protein
VPGSPTGSHRTSGTLDLALPTPAPPPYYLAVVVANNLTSVGGSPAEEMNNITLTHFTVELSAPGVAWSGSCPSTHDSPTVTEFLPPGGATVGAGFEVITSAHSQCILPTLAATPTGHLTVTVKVWAKGRHGGTGIESAPFIYNVDVCLGCLQTDYTDPALVVYRYPADFPLCASLTGTNPYPGDACLPPGQDVTILCCGLTTTVAGAPKDTVLCPGVFTGTTATATATTTQ